jgi:SAM-dependent methyltransferase
MQGVLGELQARPLAAGLLSCLPRLYEWWDNRRPTGNTASSTYSRGIWTFHRDNYHRHSAAATLGTVAELGPGATLATCIAALCDGVGQAVGLDVCPYAGGSTRNLKMLDELWPAPALPDPRRQQLVAAISHLGTLQSLPTLQYVAPWTSAAAVAQGSVDLIFSHSVLEHVDDPETAYNACFRWLRPGGLMSHKIDHSAHGITRSWNGHYALPDWLWTVIRGGRPYLLNRMPSSEHRRLIEAAGFEILEETLVKATASDRSTRARLRVTDRDASIKTSTFICRRPA